MTKKTATTNPTEQNATDTPPVESAKRPNHQSDDRLFRTFLKDAEKAKLFFREHLPAELKKLVDIDSMELLDGSQTNFTLKDTHSDILYIAQIDGQEGYVVLDLGHESRHSAGLPFKKATYNLSIMKWHWKKKGIIPPVINCTCYNGRVKSYTHALSLAELCQDAALSKELFFGKIHLINLNTEPDAAILEREAIGILEIVLKYKGPDLMNKVLELAHSGRFWELIEGLDALDYQAVATYLFNKLSEQDGFSGIEFVNLLAESVPEPKAEQMMTFAQEFRQEGRQEGIWEEKLAVAKAMLKEGAELSFIKRITHLSFQKLKALKKQLSEESSLQEA